MQMDKISHICRSKGIKIIEDAAQASGTITPMVPSRRKSIVFDFFILPQRKTYPLMGDAGAILM